jgi:hypothetical protein
MAPMGVDENGGCDGICSMPLLLRGGRASMLGGSDVVGGIDAAGVGVEVVGAIGGGQGWAEFFCGADDAGDG